MNIHPHNKISHLLNYAHIVLSICPGNNFIKNRFLIYVAYCIHLQPIEEKVEVAAQECDSIPVESSDSCDELLFNPNVFTEFKLAGSQEVS